MRNKITVGITSELKARLKESSERTPSERIRNAIDDVDKLIARGLIDLTPVKKEHAKVTFRLSARQHDLVAEAAARVGLRPHQLLVRIIQHLAR